MRKGDVAGNCKGTIESTEKEKGKETYIQGIKRLINVNCIHMRRG
jgi:hypothetical protein